MPPFRFRLQRPLEWRVTVRDRAIQELAHATAALEAEKAHLARQRGDLERALAEQRRVQHGGRGGIEAWRISAAAAVVSAVREQIELQRRIIREAEAEVEVRREAVVESRKAHRSLEMLRDRDKSVWRSGEERRDQIELDELFSRRGH